MASSEVCIETGPAIGALRDIQRKAGRSPWFAQYVAENVAGMRFELLHRGGVFVLVPGAIAKALLRAARRSRRIADTPPPQPAE
jgi:hypothetical protein